MNKFWAAAAVSIAATAAHAAKDSWLLVVGGATKEMAFFVETTTFARSGNLVTYWWYAAGKDDGTLNASQPMIRQVRAKTEMDCAHRRYRLLSEINYSGNGQVLSSANGAAQWEEIVPGTTFGGTAEAVCDPKFTRGGARATYPVGDDLRRATAVWFETTAQPGADGQADTQTDHSSPARVQITEACRPEWPEAARRAGAHGTSMVKVTVDMHGIVTDSVVVGMSGGSREHRLLDTVAREALARCPATAERDSQGRPRAGVTVVSYEWRP